MTKKAKRKKRKLKRTIHRKATLAHRIALSLHAEAQSLQEITAWLVKVLEFQEYRGTKL